MSCSCFVVGEGALLVECVDVLIQAHFVVKGVISPDDQLRAPVESKGLRFIERKPGWSSSLREEPFDYLFSIVNDAVLSADTLKLPRRLAINYHDGPLPAYAGVRATFWALVNGEKAHGITWHVMQPQVDAGAILSQVLFPLTEDETSVSLNTRCFTAALDSFRELVIALSTDRISPQPQDPTRRSYYGRNQRPNLRLDWRRPATQLAALSRALQFGFHPNPFGLLKFWVQDAVFLVQYVEVAQRVAQYPPGTVKFVDAESLAVTTADGVLTLRGVLTPEGEPVAVAALTERFGWQPGVQLPNSTDDETTRWHHRATQCVPYQAYWVDKLVHFKPTALEPVGPLPTVEPQDKMGQLEFQLSPALSILRINSQLSLPELVLCTFLIYLSRVSGDSRLGVGFSSDALRQSLDESGGLLAGCVPFTVDVDARANFGEICQHVRQELDWTGEHDTFAREMLITQPALHAFAVEFRRGGFPVEIWLKNERFQKVPAVRPGGLTLVISELGPCRFLFDPAVWDASRVAELAQRWTLLVEKLSRYPDRPVVEVDLLTTEERYRLLHVWSSAPMLYPRDTLVHRLVEEQVARRPGAVALRCGPVALTYDDLNRRANALAWQLQKQGVGPDTPVGVCLDRSPELVISLLAILKAGGAYVPLDPAYPTTRLNTLQAEADIRLVVTTSALAARLAETTADCLLLDQIAAELAQESAENPSSDTRAEHLAYVLFTSGSTGQPKGVAVPHRGVVRLVSGANFARLDETTVMLGLAPLAFDASTLELWGSLANGGQLVLLPEARPSLDVIKETVREHGVTTTFVTAALFNVLVDSGIAELTSLRDVLTGGDVVSPTHVARAYRQLPGCRFINGYGPTESTTFASFYPIPPGEPDAPTVPIGTPVGNTQLFILDAHLNLVPPGALGELVIGGDGLARGYLGDPELTADRFVPHPFSLDPNDRIYKTGDRARFLPDGRIEFLGRMDDQVKIRGFRIEPGEIETALCQHPDVREAVVVTHEPVQGDKRLVAYLVFRPEITPDMAAVRAFLQNRLPEHLIPTGWVPLDTLPLTRNGKVDKKRLPPPMFTPTRKPTDAPRTETEERLQILWAELLNTPRVGEDDSFFDLGGNSLLAIQLLARIHQQWGIRPAVRDVFAHPTLRQLSAFLDELPKENQPARQTFSSLASAAEAPLSLAQRRLWVLHQLHDLGGTYNVPLVLRVNGPLNLPVLQRSLEILVLRHQALRTTFGYTDGQPFQRVGAAFSVPLPVTELPTSATGPVSTEAERWLTEEAYQLFDLERGPLLRARVARFGAEDHLVLLLFHHLIFDGFSVRVLASELSALYSHGLCGEDTPLPFLPLQYPDYARWQVAHPDPTTLAASVAYWKDSLAGAPPLLALPADYPRPSIQTFAGADVAFTLPPAIWKALTKYLADPGTTPFMRLLAATAVWLGRQAGTNDVVIGVPIAGRTQAEVGPLIGFFVNTLVLRIDLSENLTFRDLLHHVRQRALEAYEHQELPFEQLVEIINPPRTPAYAPLVQVVIDFNEEPPDAWQLEGLHTEQLSFKQHTSKFDLNVSFRQTNQGLQGIFNYNSDLFKRETVVRWTEEFVRLVEDLTHDPAQPLALGTRIPAEPVISPRPVAPERTGVPRESRIISAEETQDLDTLRALWEQLLGVNAVGIDDDFFDLGGNSLMVFQLATEWQRQTGRKLPASLVFAYPTLRQLAGHVGRNLSDAPSCALVCIQPQGIGNALFFVHDVSGDVDYVRQLGPYLTAGRPVVGLESPRLHGEGPLLTTLEEIATHHIDLIVAHQPEGPYALAGYSLGGIIAFEMARQLRRSGQQVALLALLDSYPVTPEQSSLERVPLRYVLRNYWNFWRAMPKRPVALMAVVREKVPSLVRYLTNRVRRFVKPASLALEEQIGPEMAAFYAVNPLVEAHIDAYNRYVFRPSDVRAVFFRASSETVYGNLTKHLKNFDFGWSRYALGGVEVHELPGTHATMIKDAQALTRIGEILTERMNSLEP